MRKLFVIANWMQGTGLSGGDRIFIELVKRWRSKLDIVLLLSQDGAAICRREGLNDIKLQVWALDYLTRFGKLVNLLYRTGVSICRAFSVKASSGDIVYSTSDFWPDSFPAFIIKRRNPGVNWVAGFYLFAPKPWQKDSPYRGKRWLIGLFYWLTQQLAYYVIWNFADKVFVTSQPDRNLFITSQRPSERVIVVRGGVDTGPAEDYLSSGSMVPLEERKYDACFVGRFHYQKGVLELIQTWKIVCEKRPGARLAMIGVGPLEAEIKYQIDQLGLAKSIDLLGFRDGERKFEIFRQSRIVVHPATYDSGGMAAAEAMAWGLPGVSFALEALKTYYPKGMLKTPCFDLHEFANNVIRLISDSSFYQTQSHEAEQLIQEQWKWDSRAHEIYDYLMADEVE